MKTAALLLAVLLGLGGCSLMPSRLEMGTPRDEVVRRLGQPTRVVPLANGTRLQYSGQPAGQWVHNVDLGPDGGVVKVEQVLDIDWMLRHLVLDVTTWDDALRDMGRPALVEHVASFKGDVWTYRYLEISAPRQAHLHFDPQGVLRRLQFTDELRHEDISPSHP